MDNSCQSIEKRFYSNVEALTIFATEAVKELEKVGKSPITTEEINKISQMVNIFKKEFLIEEFIKNSWEFAWDIIRSKDEEMFISQVGKIFSFLPAGKTDIFINVFNAENAYGERIIKQDIREKVWKALGGMVKLSIKYIKEKRTIVGSGYFDKIDVAKEAKVWQVVI